MKVTAQIKNLVFLLRAADPNRKTKQNRAKRVEAQRCIKQLNLFSERCLQLFMPLKVSVGDIKI